MESTEKIMEDFYDSNIDNNHPNFLMTWKKVKEECRALHASIDLFNKAKIPYFLDKYMFITKVAVTEMIQINDKDTA